MRFLRLFLWAVVLLTCTAPTVSALGTSGASGQIKGKRLSFAPTP